MSRSCYHRESGMNPIRFDREVCGNLDAALQREWLETNGLGGFAASTIAGLNTRRYHGLLTAATQPPAGRFLLLSKLEETLVLDGSRFDLSANRYPGVIHPRGYQYLTEFRLDPFPIFRYQVEGLEVEKRVFLVHGENTVVVEYEIRGEGVFEVRPLIAFRDYHATTHRNEALNRAVECGIGWATVTPYAGLPALHFAHDAFEVELTGHWYENFEYAVEQERGLDYREDLFNPFVARFREGRATIVASTERRDAAQAAALRRS
ncbi:MAG: glycogen debranching enzyme N-terminal domain-containing protein, partial [Bryobacteraceae bacterium]